MKYKYYLMFIALWMITSCIYKDSFAYRGQQLINFKLDSLYFSFAEVPFNVHDTIIKIPLEIVGSPIDKDRYFKIKVLKSNATEGKEYDKIDSIWTIAANKTSSNVNISIHRLKMDKDSIYNLKISLLETGDFGLGVAEYRCISIDFSNRLELPQWWYRLSKWLGDYDVRKYQKFIEIYGKPINDDYVKNNKIGVLRTFHIVRDYFNSHKEYGVAFPDVDWIV